MDQYLGLTEEQYLNIKRIEAEAVENDRRKCTKLGFRLGGMPVIFAVEGFGAFIGVMSLLVMSMMPFWGTIGTVGRLGIMQLVLMCIGLLLVITPFVIFKPKYALVAELVTAIYLIAIAVLSNGMNELMMMGVHMLLDAGISF